MVIHLIKGQFSNSDAIAIVTKMIDVKIKFQEGKIESSHNEEDIKMRENRIKALQKELFDARKQIEQIKDQISLYSEIHLEPSNGTTA